MLRPNVSHCVQENEVHYNPLVDPRLILKYNVADASNPTELYRYFEGESTAALLFDNVEIDGVNVSIADLDAAEGMYQLSVGEHTVKYTLKDETSIEGGTFWRVENISTVSIPNSVTTIGERAFSRCSSLTSITIPNSVTSIGNYAFSVSGLTSITIPESVTYIGGYAFEYCSRLTSIEIPNSFTGIVYGMFSNCSRLTSADIPNSVIYIGDYAFEGCTGLTSITIPNGVSTISDHAFERCTGLTTIDIPNSVTDIGKYAFNGCTGLTSITISNGVSTISDHAFLNCTGLTSITIPNSVTSIAYCTFENCTGLTSITIPNSVTSIGSNAFEGCTALTKLLSLATKPPKCGTNALNDINKQNCTLTIPEGTLSKYQAADQWKDFLFIEEKDLSSINTITTDDGTKLEIKETYDLNGHKITGLKRGLNIVKMSDGTAKKIVVK